jgi:hypothetical protein
MRLLSSCGAFRPARIIVQFTLVAVQVTPCAMPRVAVGVAVVGTPGLVTLKPAFPRSSGTLIPVDMPDDLHESMAEGLSFVGAQRSPE